MQKTVSEIKAVLESTPVQYIPKAVKTFESDSRASVQKLIAKTLKRHEKHIRELERLEGLLACEKELWDSGIKYIAGIDEVGRGPLAGPVVTAAVILSPDTRIEYINDSKKLSEKKREELFDIIMDKALSVCVTMEDHTVIDDINILQATLKSMKNSIEGLDIKPGYILADAVHIPDIDIPQKGIIKGDSKSMSIAAASIIAKVTRDRLMVEMDKVYPGYDFAKNKGYGTKDHINAIKEKGLCPIHRLSFTKGFIK